MNLDEFLEVARRLRNLEVGDVRHPRVLEWWGEFVQAPESFLVKCSPPAQAAIWAAVEYRREAAERDRLGMDDLLEEGPQAAERRRVAGTTTASEE